jgi:hypothetical protein
MNDPIIQEFVGALITRAEQQGVGQLGYIHGYLTSFLESLKLGTFEREIMQKDTDALYKFIEEYDQLQEPSQLCRVESVGCDDWH